MASKLINDLTRIPGIVASLGLGIADAQKRMNLGYLESLEVLIGQVKSLLGGPDKDKGISPEFLSQLLMNLAPPRYQFTETTFAVKLDLSQSIDVTVEGGLGFALGAFVVNAAYAVGYSSDYRAAAECRTVIHAVLPSGDNKALFDALLKSAAALDAKALDLPARTEISTELINATNSIAAKFNAAPAPITPPANG